MNEVTLQMSELDSYAAFIQGWDGYNGSVFSAEVIQTAKTLLESIQSIMNYIP
jgi:hypothetical protein